MKNFAFRPFRAFALSITLLALSLSAFAQKDSTTTFHIGFIYPVSSNGKNAAAYTNRFSLHAIAGLSRGETGLALAGVAHVVRQDINGVALAGVANVVNQNVSGVQMAGAVNVIGNSARGAQLAGVANVIGNSATGAQLAGFANITKNEAKGAQLAGFMNLAGSAGAAQVAGFANIARKDAKGLQLAGFLNKGNEVNAQVAGFANVAKKVKGIQLAGFINIADSSDYPIAIFNFIKNGEKSVALTLDETMTSIVSFRSGGRVLYGIAGVGYNFKDNPRDMYAIEAGLGAHIQAVRNLRVNVEAVSHMLTDFHGGAYYKNSLRILPALKFGNRFEVFAGPTFNYVSYDREDDFDFVKKYIWKNNKSKDFQGLFVGFNTGVQILF